MHSHTEENYLKAIFKLQQGREGGVGTNEISELMQTRPASVTDMLRKLAQKELLFYERYKGVELTEKGKLAAIMVVRKHRLWECFLVNSLQYKWDEVHVIAEQLEHVQAEDLIDRLDDFLGNPTHDPHGDPIPTRAGSFRPDKMISLSEAAVHQQVVLSGVTEHSTQFLQYLGRLGLGLGTVITVEDRNEYDQSMWVKINNENPITISREISRSLLVSNIQIEK
jgi:DtxR family Mn-dependent transcriptional regulator